MYEAPSLEEWNEVRWNGILTTWGVFNDDDDDDDTFIKVSRL